MRIVKAAHLGMCFGVRDAIELALDQSQASPPTVLGDLVHNETVLDSLRNQGVQFADHPGQIQTSTAIVTAHGTSQRTLRKLQDRGLQVLHATCPLVGYAHRTVTQLVQQGWHPVIIGQHNHVEVKGLTDDLTDFDVVLTEEDVDQLREKPRFGVAAQTTQPIKRVRYLVTLIERRFPQSAVRFIDTVCQPTKQRQTAAEDLAREVDVVVVIGGASSNNTRELVKTCSTWCDRVFHVQTASELRSTWFAGTETIGITAGTSTPDQTITEVTAWLEDLARFQNQLARHINPSQRQ